MTCKTCKFWTRSTADPVVGCMGFGVCDAMDESELRHEDSSCPLEKEVER